jgi:hypothetical protein
MHEGRPDYLLPYDEAKSFWHSWHGDPNADMAITDPWLAVEGLLINRYRQHPIEAAYTARIALESVIDSMENPIA